MHFLALRVNAGRNASIAVMALVIGLATTACGGDDAKQDVIVTASDGEVSIKTPAGQTRFDVDTINATAGDLTVTYANESTAAHNFMVHGLDGIANSDPQQTSTVTFALEAGKTYEFFCSLFSHEAQGMRGSIVVS